MATKSVHTTKNDELQQYLLSLAKLDKTRGVTAEYNESLKLKELQEKLLFDSFLAAEEEGEHTEVALGTVDPQQPKLQNGSVIRWAGGAFENCPSPDDLPLPSFLPSGTSSGSPKKGQKKPFTLETKVYRYEHDRKNKKFKNMGSGSPFFYQQKM